MALPAVIWRGSGMTTIDAPQTILENGHSPTTPARDNLVLDVARTEAAAYGALARAAGGRVRVVDDLGLHLCDAASPSPFGNMAHVMGPIVEADAPRLANELSAFYGGRDGGPFLLFSRFPVGDLRPHGLSLAGHPPLMVRPAGVRSAGADVQGLEIVRVATPAELADFERTLIDAYPSPELAPFGTRPRMFRNAILESPWNLLVGYLDGQPVATAAAFLGADVLIVEAVSTRADMRGRGIGRALTGAASSLAGSRPAALLASDPGRGVYERLGYLAICRFTLWVGRR